MAATSGRQVSSIFRSGLFSGKSAIVTGGGTGIGQAIAQELLHLGCRVVIASRNVERLSESAAGMRKMIPANSPAKLEVIQCNVRKEEQVKDLMKTTLSHFGSVDYLINNGGGQFVSPASEISLKGWSAVVETNLYGTFLCCREAYNQWMKENGGVIVNMLIDHWKGTPGMSHSAAARAGIHNLTKTLSLEWASSGVRVNAVAPGSSIFSGTAAENYGSRTIFNAQKPRIPAKRLGNPEEVSAAVCFLLSPAAAFISGTSMIIDGAQTLYTTPNEWPIEDHNNLPAYSWEKDLEEREKQKHQSVNSDGSAPSKL